MKKVVLLLLSIQFLFAQPLAATDRNLNIGEEINRVVLNRIIFQYQSVENSQKFLEKFGSNFSRVDNKFLKKSLGSTNKLPKLRKDGQTLFFDQTSFQVINLIEKKFKINGVEWIYNSSSSIEDQIKKIEQAKVSSSRDLRFDILTQFFVPRANAYGALVGTVVAAGLATIATNICAIGSKGPSIEEAWMDCLGKPFDLFGINPRNWLNLKKIGCPIPPSKQLAIELRSAKKTTETRVFSIGDDDQPTKIDAYTGEVKAGNLPYMTLYTSGNKIQTIYDDRGKERVILEGKNAQQELDKRASILQDFAYYKELCRDQVRLASFRSYIEDGNVGKRAVDLVPAKPMTGAQ